MENHLENVKRKLSKFSNQKIIFH